MTLVYVDASALVKLVLDEPESPTLRRYLDGLDLVSSEIVVAELGRAIRRAIAADAALPLDTLLERAIETLEALALLPLDRELVLSAGALPEPALRTLDAIHVAAALELGRLDAFVTYDERQAAAARLSGLRTIAPGS